MRQKPIPPALTPFLEGKALLIDKPLHWTSFDMVKKVRWLTRIMKVGHAGTLDPLATGLLIICTGKYTKQINDYMGMIKEYTGSLVLGATTASYDLEQEPENFKSIDSITASKILETTQQFIGTIFQMPPQHSAIKKDGKRLYESARQGIEVKVDPRQITIEAFEITKIDLPTVEFRVVCSTGTYIRSLVHDFGQALGVGAYMSGLRRTKIGAFNVEDAIQWEDLEKEINDLLEG
ncbi:MAG: tRNA pseudouridine(55) synthase TruB [Sediminibacterium sp.]|nr:tRNA pseudouridine(55) synthase TruB [Sediminibacterium sp.]MBP6144421.1 tRNA pseudouridine(55) synthase TruB [Sediminibacterium sp.]